MWRIFKAAAVLSLALLGTGTRPAQAAPPATVPELDLARYAGLWYEIASVPIVFTRGCTATTAFYEIRPDGKVRVLNQCHKDSLDGELSRVEGKAWRPDAKAPGKLKVSFFWPFSGDYWVVGLAPDYAWAVVSDAKRRSCWILSRSPSMDEKLYQEITGRLAKDGYDLSKLRRTLQPPAGSADPGRAAPRPLTPSASAAGTAK